MSTMLYSHYHYPRLELAHPKQKLCTHYTTKPQPLPSPPFSFLPRRICFLQAPRASQSPRTDFCGRSTSRRIRFQGTPVLQRVSQCNLVMKEELHCVRTAHCFTQLPVDRHPSCYHFSYVNNAISFDFGVQVSALHHLLTPFSGILFYSLWEILYSLQIKQKQQKHTLQKPQGFIICINNYSY